ncbi:hypothetical protein C2G38_2169917 [Gigaspora rosea]|uniref:Uncharacterized protein n=1 Tax=Gigaspora rosea TaxID=44941 RepID=A0A397VV81_9GLOM|nr:hypothetical protein C2G38_2169917 [Gigaspora rosea]
MTSKMMTSRTTTSRTTTPRTTTPRKTTPRKEALNKRENIENGDSRTREIQEPELVLKEKY